MAHSDLDTTLESLIDTHSIHEVLCSLERICDEKAEYVRSGGSHGDPSPRMATLWSRTAALIFKATTHCGGL